MTYALCLKDLGYTHKDVLRMTPRACYTLWIAIPDPELMPKQSDDPALLMGGAF